MPKNDGTGPLGMGPGTGRGLGQCFGFGPFCFGCRRRGVCRFLGFNRMSKNDQKSAISDYIKALEEELQAAKEELKDLENQQDKG